MTILSPENIGVLKFEFTSRGHGPTMFFSQFTCRRHPRLRYTDRGDKKARKMTRIFSVDGIERADLAAAIEALNTPPEISAEEQSLLDTVPEAWTAPEKGTRGDLYGKFFGLSLKALVEWNNGEYRRRPQP